MKAIKFILAGGVGFAALAAASPAAAQYYPYPNSQGNVLGQVLGQILNPGYGGYGGGYGLNSQALVDRCAAAVTHRVNAEYGGYSPHGQQYGGGYGPNGYGYNGNYGYNAYGGGARVVAITSVERRSSSKFRVRGIAEGAPVQAGYGYNAVPLELSFRCNVDVRGRISDIDLDRTNRYQADRYNPYAPYGNYRRY